MKIVREDNVTIALEASTECPYCKFHVQEGDEVCVISGKIFHKGCFEELKESK